jgi:hypothetical protein
MDKISDSVKSVQNESAGFFSYVFNFDMENKYRIMNMLQYTMLTIIPVLLILRGIKHIIPEDDESKGSLEILAESVGQVILIMLAIWFTNKIIYYIPTYSGEEYPKFNEISFIIPFILILATMQTKLGAKFNILIDRVMGMIFGKRDEARGQQQQQGQNVVRVSQPLAGQMQGQIPIHQPSQADYLDRNQLLPSNPMMSSMPTKYPAQQLQQQQPAAQDFNNMYQQAPEPMAANDGGGWGSTW